MAYAGKLRFVAVAGCAALGVTGIGAVVAAPADAPDGVATLETVLVTAEKRSQSLQTVPVSITVLSGEELESAKSLSLMDVQKRVPGLTITQASTGQPQIFIRGIGTDIVGAGLEDAVAVYIDGVYQSRSAGTAMQFIDVERIEVLKGPQGTLYGRNATGGAINIVSKAPSREKTGQFDIQAGSYDQRIVRGTLSGPLSEGVVNARLSVLYNRDEGDTRNLLLNRSGNSNDIRGVRGSFEFLPGHAFSALVNAHYYQNDVTSVFKPLYPAVNPLFSRFGATVIDDPRTVMQNFLNQAKLTDSGIDATAQWDLGTALLSSVTALRRTDYQVRSADLDGTEIPLMNIGSPISGVGIAETTDYFSQEFVLASDNAGPLAWTGLLSYSHQKVDAPGFNVSMPLLGLTTNSLAAVATDAAGVGGQASYSWGNGVRLTGGARYSRETKNLEHKLSYINEVLTGAMSDKKTWSAVTPKLVLDYAPDRHKLFYASASKGFKSGGYNTVAIQPSFDPETAISYEAGIKSTLFDGRLRLNLAAFYTHYDDMQVSIVLATPAGTIYSVVQNAAKAVSKGVEASFAAKPTSRFELSGGVQWLNARYGEFVTVDPRYPGGAASDQKGNPLSRAPDFTASLAAQYTWPVERGAVTLRGEGNYRSKIYYTPFKDAYASDPALTLWNAFLSYEPAKKAGLYGAAFVKNLTDKTYTSGVFDPQSLGYLA